MYDECWFVYKIRNGETMIVKFAEVSVSIGPFGAVNIQGTTWEEPRKIFYNKPIDPEDIIALLNSGEDVGSSD